MVLQILNLTNNNNKNWELAKRTFFWNEYYLVFVNGEKNLYEYKGEKIIKADWKYNITDVSKEVIYDVFWVKYQVVEILFWNSFKNVLLDQNAQILKIVFNNTTYIPTQDSLEEEINLNTKIIEFEKIKCIKFNVFNKEDANWKKISICKSDAYTAPVVINIQWKEYLISDLQYNEKEITPDSIINVVYYDDNLEKKEIKISWNDARKNIYPSNEY